MDLIVILFALQIVGICAVQVAGVSLVTSLGQQIVHLANVATTKYCLNQTVQSVPLVPQQFRLHPQIQVNANVTWATKRRALCVRNAPLVSIKIPLAILLVLPALPSPPHFLLEPILLLRAYAKLDIIKIHWVTVLLANSAHGNP